MIFTLFWYVVLAPVSQDLWAQDSCTKNLDLAQAAYYQGQFDESLSLVKACIEAGGMQNKQLARAYKILAQIYLAKNLPDAARLVAGKLLELQPEYMPSISEEPPSFVKLVEEIRAEKLAQIQLPPEENNKWLWIGAGGVAVISVITIIALTKNGDDEGSQPLPEPPPWPNH